MQCAKSLVGEFDVVTTCMFCNSNLSFGTKLLHDRYCSAEHKEAYLQAMDRLGLERLTAARPRINSYEPCTKPVALEPLLSKPHLPARAEPKAPKFATRPRPRLELAQGEAAAVAGL